MNKKTRCGGRWTEAKYFGNIRQCFRRLSMQWAVKNDILKESRQSYTGDNKRRKWEYKCVMCKYYFIREDVQVDHIIQAGSLKSYEDLPGFVERLLCEVDNLQVLCRPCHQEKTNG